MPAKQPRRTRISAEIESSVLIKSRRRCALCFHLDQNEKQKKGQIVHLDRRRANNIEDNLAWLCWDHHTEYDSTASQHKNYTIEEVKHARNELYAWVDSALGRAVSGNRYTVKAPSSAEPKKPVSLKDLFENDWSNLTGYYGVSSIEGPMLHSKGLQVAWRLNGDFAARSKFLAFFIEPTTPANDALHICAAIADHYGTFIATADSKVDIIGQTPDDTSSTHMKDMIFSKRVFIYYEGSDFSLEQKGSIEALYKSKGMSVQFRDAAYAWSHRDDDKQLRPNPLVPNSTLLPDARLTPGLKITVVALE